LRAVVYLGPGKADLVEVDRPHVGPGHVLIGVRAAGVCHTDLHLRSGRDPRITPGRILGHEIAGVIEELGEGVSGWTLRQKVAVYPVWSCGACPRCRSGHRNACLRTAARLGSPPTPGITADGGMAEYVAVPVEALIDVAELDPGVAATMTDAALSPYGSIEPVRHLLRPGTSAVVIGLGGLGSMALQILRATTAVRIIALDVDDDALVAAERFSDQQLRADDPATVGAILDATGGSGAVVVLDLVGIDQSLATAVDVVAPFGAIQVNGMGGGRVAFTAGVGSRLPRGVAVSPMQFSGSYLDLIAVMALARDGSLRPDLVRFGFSDALEALNALHAGRVRGRAVLDF
jgi:propanol-preferring alcohol dehydrogenase